MTRKSIHTHTHTNKNKTNQNIEAKYKTGFKDVTLNDLKTHNSLRKKAFFFKKYLSVAPEMVSDVWRELKREDS